ncbi:MAG: hypothetical protein ACMUIU_12205, partial [bacterium]
MVKVSTKLNRLFEDYDDEIEDIKYGFNKERSTVEANLIHHYKGYDGTHVPRIYKNSLNDFLEKLDKRLKKLIQDVENILLECYETKDINLISKLEKEKLKFEYMIKKTNQRVLIVDDEESIQELFCKVLTKHGHHAEVAEDGRLGFRMATTF